MGLNGLRVGSLAMPNPSANGGPFQWRKNTFWAALARQSHVALPLLLRPSTSRTSRGVRSESLVALEY